MTLQKNQKNKTRKTKYNGKSTPRITNFVYILGHICNTTVYIMKKQGEVSKVD